MIGADAFLKMIVASSLFFPQGECIRNSVEETVGFLPPLSDLERFPSWETARTADEFGMAYKQYLEFRVKFDDCSDREKAAEALQESIRCNEPWSELRIATSSSANYWDRRVHLQRLKEWLGEDNYRLGIMPPMVPYWRFQRLD